MTNKTASDASPLSTASAAKVLDSVKLDFSTIKIMVLTILAVLSILSFPLFFLLSNLVTFESLDKRFKMTQSISPKILQAISEEIQAGYSKNITMDSPFSHDTSLIFYAAKDQKVTLTMDVTMRSGPYQAIGIQVDGCDVGPGRNDMKHFYFHELTSLIDKCGQGDEPSVHTLRVYTQQPLKAGTALDVTCLVLVYQRVHAHLENIQ